MLAIHTQYTEVNMKRLNLIMDETTMQRLDYLQNEYQTNRTSVIKIAITELYREVLKRQSVSPSTVGQQGSPTVLGEGRQEETEGL